MILTTLPATNVRTARRGEGGLHPGTASQLTVQAGSNQTAVAGTAVPIPPAVLVRDQLGSPVPQASLQFVVVGGGTATELAADVFTRANENPLAGNWTKVGGAATNLQLVSNAVQGITAGGEGMMYYNAVTWPADQYAECRVTVLPSTGGGGPAVRLSGADQTGYIAQVTASGTIVSCAKFVAGAYTQLQTISTSLVPTDTLRLEVRGSTLRVFKNGAQIGSDMIDGSIATGNAGLDLFDTTGYVLDNWAGGLPPSTSGSVAPSTPIQTDAAGIAAPTSWTLGTVAGANTLMVTSPGLLGSPVTFTATGIGGAPQATQIAINGGNAQSAAIGTNAAIPPSVLVRDANNAPVVGVSVTFAVASGGGSVTGATQSTNASGIATVGGWTLGPSVGANTLTASSAGLTGSPLTFTATGLAISIPIPDPTALPVAAAQVPNVAAYVALNLPGQAAGFTYLDPLTGVRIWKATSATVPAANSGAGHDYGEGPTQASRAWGTNSHTHTILIRGAGMAYYLVDFTRGSGFSNYRVINGLTFRDLAFGFSNVAGQERMAYALSNTDGKLHRYDTAANALADTGFFPVTINTVTPADMTWLHQDKTDTWFVGLKDATTAFAWNSVTNELRTHVETWLNEVKFERDGRYLGLTGGGPGPFRYWDLLTDTFGPSQTIGVGAAKYYFSHNAGCRSMWISVNPDLIFAQDRMVVSGGQITKTQISTVAASSGDEHNAGNWIQPDAQLPGGDLNKQWSYLNGGGTNAGWTPTVHHAIGVQRNDGSDTRILCHHYSSGDFAAYWDTPFALPSPDGLVVLFNSNMNGSGRYDLFVAEVPLQAAFVPDFYVSPTGLATNTGSIDSPWSLSYALSGAGGAITPGKLIALRGGTYTGNFVSTLAGTAANPIVVRQYPGERAIIDGQLGQFTGSNVRYQGFEVMRSIHGGAALGVFIQTPGIELINLIVHDHTMSGIYIEGSGSLDSRVYGCISYNNGDHNDGDHGVYFHTQGANTSALFIEENITFNNIYFGLHGFATGSASQTHRNETVRGNIGFNNGSISNLGSNGSDLLLGGFQAGAEVINGLVDTNYCWRSGSGAHVVDQMMLWIGYPGYTMVSATVQNNYGYTYNGIAYFPFQAGQPVTANNTSLRWGVDAFPATNKVVVRANAYETGRGHIAVYNYQGLTTVSVDLSTILSVGQLYNIFNVQDLFGTPVASGTYTGALVSVPMTGITAPALIGRSPQNTAPTTGPSFHAFLVRLQGA